MPNYTATITPIATNLIGNGSMTQVPAPWEFIDDGSKELSFPFAVNFLGNIYNSVFLHSNGYLTFGSAPPDATYFEEAIGFERLLFLAGDHQMIATYTLTQGTAPNRKYTIRFESSSDYTLSVIDCVCEISFYENDTGDLNRIEVQYGITGSLLGPEFTGIFNTANLPSVTPWAYDPNTGFRIDNFAEVVVVPSDYHIIGPYPMLLQLMQMV